MEAEASMIFCQSCGAKNPDDARFCNMCGTSIAEAGAPGGPIAESHPARGASTLREGAASASGGASTSSLARAPSPYADTSSITLTGIGVPSRAKTWSILIGGALLFLSLGVGGAWLAMRGGGASAESAAAGADTPPPPPAPEPPSGLVTSEPEATTSAPDEAPRASTPSPRGSTSRPAGAQASRDERPSAASTPSASGAGSAQGGSAGRGSSGASASGGGGSSPAGGGAGQAGSAGAGQAGASQAGGASAGSTSEATGAGSTSSGSGAGASGSGRDWGALDQTVGDDDVDIETERYVTTVRRFIRDYYGQRAHGCFEHASAESGAALRGRVVIQFTIGPDGRVSQASVQNNTTGNASVAECLQRNVAGWQLPVPPRREPMMLALPFSP